MKHMIRTFQIQKDFLIVRIVSVKKGSYQFCN